mgnify:CR=1 FL=1
MLGDLYNNYGVYGFHEGFTTYKSLKKGIQYVYSGLQKSNYPILPSEQNKILFEYYRLVNKKDLRGNHSCMIG